MLGKGFLEFMPFCIIRRIVRKAGEARSGGVGWFLCEWGPVASGLNIVPAETIEVRKSGENTEYAEEVKKKFPVSPWDEDCPDGVR